MFKKGPDIDKKKLLVKASDVKKDSSTRLKHFKTLIEHLDYNELQVLFKSHFSFIYHTFIDTFSTFDCNSKQRRDDLECLLFMLEKILINNADLIKKRWQFYSITFVMQKLLHQNNTWQVRQEGLRLFILWYQILRDEQNNELQIIFASLVPSIVPSSSLPKVQTPLSPLSSPSNVTGQQPSINQHNHYLNQQQSSQLSSQATQLPIKLCNIDPLMPAAPNEQLPINGGDESSFYLDSLLQYMITQTTKPNWSSLEEARRNQELGFSFIFNMFKKIYLQHLFPNFNAMLDFSSITKSSYHSNVNRYVSNEDNATNDYKCIGDAPSNRPGTGCREGLQIDLQLAKYHVAPPSPSSKNNNERTSLDQEQFVLHTNYQAIVIKWLTRILRQELILGQDELALNRSGLSNSAERNLSGARDPKRREASSGLSDTGNTLSPISDAMNQSSTLIHGAETREMEIARRVIGTWPENITVVHELFRRSFLNFYQPASMKRVVNVYKEWICTGSPSSSQPGGVQTTPVRSIRLGYASFSDLLQVFVLNSSNAFLAKVNNHTMLDEQVEMCKRIMNIYRYMVMKIYMNTQTWEQLLNVMLQITEHLFPVVPPEKKELTIGGRIAPAFFQTFIVSWIRANLYVHISAQMWRKFHGVMKNLIRWRELIEEWSNTMGSLTRVLVKHVYGLSLTDLPLDRPQDKRRRPRALKSFSTAEVSPPTSVNNSPVKSTATTNRPTHPSASESDHINDAARRTGVRTTSSVMSDDHHQARSQRSDSSRLNNFAYKNFSRQLTRSNSDGAIFFQKSLLYYSTAQSSSPLVNRLMRKIKSEHLIIDPNPDTWSGRGQSNSPMVHNDVIDGTSLKDSNLIIEHEQALDSHHSGKSSLHSSHGDSSTKNSTNSSKRPATQGDTKQQEKCVLLGGTVRGWTHENSVIMWRRMLGLFGNINLIEDPANHLVAIKCLAIILCDFIKTRENLGISLDNHLTPEQPELVPPYTYAMAWLLEATHLPPQYNESRLMAYKLLCMMSIRRHDIELSPQYYTAFYEALQRGLASADPSIHSAIIKYTPQLLSLELPGSTLLVHSLHERSRAILLSQVDGDIGIHNGQSKPASQVQISLNQNPRDQSIQILGSILALHKPIRKLMVLKAEPNNLMNLVASGDLKTRTLDTLLSCNSHPIVMDTQNRCKSLCSMCLHVYQEIADGRNDGMDVEKLFDALLTELQDACNAQLSRVTCDILRLFSDHAQALISSRPTSVSSLIQIICQQIVRLSTDDVSNKEFVHFLLICLEDWCMAVGGKYLLKPIEMQLSTDESIDDTLSGSLNDSLITIVLRSLESVINDEQFSDNTDSSQRGARGSIVSNSRTSDTHSSSRHHSHGKGSSFEGIGGRDGRTLTNENHQSVQNSSSSKLVKNSAIKLACKVTHLKLITYMGHFPLRRLGPASMSCCVNELDYLYTTGLSEQDTASEFNSSASIILLVLDDSTIISFIGSTLDASTGLYQPVHMVVRNLCGKYSWDASCVDLDLINNNSTKHNNRNQYDSSKSQAGKDCIVLDADSFQEQGRGSLKYESDYNDEGNISSSLSSRASSNRDCIGDLLNHLSLNFASANNGSSIGSSSTYHQQLQRKRSSAQSVSNPRLRITQAEETMIALLTNQRFQELNYNERSDESDKIVLNIAGPNEHHDSVDYNLENQSKAPSKEHQSQHSLTASLEQCRQLVQQLGYLSWEKRFKINSLAKSQRLLRELKNLDAQPNRDTHKLAVIYVANGQEDKTSILMNSTGSKAFEDFVASLGWEVNLSSHLGFKGGLQTNKSTGETSPYYCNATTEIMFHVSTRIPIHGPADDESLNRKLRHLGNDEVHIVWSEHTRDYRRGIIPTEFGDVIIAIYPMLTFQGYYRIQISNKEDVPIFGPLYDNCIVHQSSLAQLVRATAVNASRAKRLNLPYYQTHYEERSRLIESIVKNHIEKVSFEDYAIQLYNTSELKLPTINQQSLAGATDQVSSGVNTAACC